MTQQQLDAFATKQDLADVETRLNTRMDSLEAKVDRLETKVNGLTDMVGTIQKTTNEILGILKNGHRNEDDPLSE